MTAEPGAAGSSDPESETPGSRGERLWSPWRMRYVAGGSRETGCLFCNRLGEDDDTAALILHRGDRAFAIMNLFPYNTGHLMIVPRTHVASPEDADVETMAEMTALRAPILRALRRALAPDGFNLGLNIGATAGAGVADHLHEHVVPRWQGDANFMPILAATTVMPELIPVTYAKLRAEIAREIGGGSTARGLILSPDGAAGLVDAAGEIPRVSAVEGEPLWRTVLHDAQQQGVADAEIAGWVGQTREPAGTAAFVLLGTLPDRSSVQAEHRLETVDRLLTGPDAAAFAAAVQRITHGGANLRTPPIGPG